MNPGASGASKCQILLLTCLTQHDVAIGRHSPHPPPPPPRTPSQSFSHVFHITSIMHRVTADVVVIDDDSVDDCFEVHQPVEHTKCKATQARRPDDESTVGRANCLFLLTRVGAEGHSSFYTTSMAEILTLPGTLVATAQFNYVRALLACVLPQCCQRSCRFTDTITGVLADVRHPVDA